MSIFTFKIAAVQNDFNASMRGGQYETFVWLPAADGYADGVRADRLDGAVVLSRAAKVGGSYTRASERHSATKVEVALPVGSVTMYTDGAVVDRLDDRGEWQSIKHIGPVRRGEKFVTVVEIDGVRVDLPGDEPTARARRTYEAEIAREAEQRRFDEDRKRRAEEMERLRIERAALAEIAAEEAAEAGYPALKGTDKQIAYADQIRAAYAKKKPADKVLWGRLTAKWWIENHRAALKG